MLGILKQPYVFAVVLAVLTAGLMYVYARTVEADKERCNKTFFKTLAIASVSGLLLAYAASWAGSGSGGAGDSGPGGAGELATEPFMPER